jgi:CBS domain-containing protein
MKGRDVMTSDLFTVDPDMSLREATGLMIARH